MSLRPCRMLTPRPTQPSSKPRLRLRSRSPPSRSSPAWPAWSRGPASTTPSPPTRRPSRLRPWRRHRSSRPQTRHPSLPRPRRLADAAADIVPVDEAAEEVAAGEGPVDEAAPLAATHDAFTFDDAAPAPRPRVDVVEQPTWSLPRPAAPDPEPEPAPVAAVEPPAVVEPPAAVEPLPAEIAAAPEAEPEPVAAVEAIPDVCAHSDRRRRPPRAGPSAGGHRPSPRPHRASRRPRRPAPPVADRPPLANLHPGPPGPAAVDAGTSIPSPRSWPARRPRRCGRLRAATSSSRRWQQRPRRPAFSPASAAGSRSRPTPASAAAAARHRSADPPFAAEPRSVAAVARA